MSGQGSDRASFYRDARHDLAGPLDGMRVVEATTTWAGPMAGCLLADFGADVVRVEDPRGEIGRRAPPHLPGATDGDRPLSFMQATVNRNKRSLAMDLKQPEAREVFLRIAERADVVIENFRPGTLDGWGLGYDAVRTRNPATVYVSISGYGQFGPDSERVGYDPLAQAASGFLSLNGSPDGPAVKSPTFLADDLAGLHGALAALAALRHRDATGEGQHIDIALLDTLWFQSTGYLTLGAMGVELPRLGNEFRVAAPANVYAARDGDVMAGVLIDSHWKRLAGLIGRPELADDPGYRETAGRLERRSEVDRMLADWAASRTVAEIVASFAEIGIPAAAVRSYHEAAQDPGVRERDMLQPTRWHDGSSIPVTGPAAKLSRTPTRVRTPAPLLGADGEAVLAEAGYSPEAIARLGAAGIVQLPR